MKAAVALACGEVPWERSIIEAIEGSPFLQVQRRYVDASTLLADARAGLLTPAVLMSPALRGFDDKPLRALAAAGIRPVVVLDTIRPDWLPGSGLECVELANVNWPELLESLVVDTPSVAPDTTGQGADVTVFVGAGGGVGVSSLAWITASRSEHLLLVEAAAAPALAFLAGEDAASNTLRTLTDRLRIDASADPRVDAVRGNVHTLRHGAAEELSAHDAQLLLESAHRHGVRLIVDAGALPCASFPAALLAQASRVVLVASACPTGILALAQTLPTVVDRPHVVVLNRLRDSLAPGTRGRVAIGNLVERTCGARPIIVDDAVAAFDRGWLHGDWTTPAQTLPHIA